MKISTKGRYAVRLMLDLAENDTGAPIRLKDVAKRQEISEKYLEQIISVLNKAGYVQSVRGPQGGYLLRMPPEEYTVGMILRLTEGSLTAVDCKDGSGPCHRENGCAARLLWKKLDDAVSGVVDHITLEDMLKWQNARADDYVI
ncbi:MAG: Rrf2 family transcriptional regulator [Eubacteriales bacterium]|nr:Rrf2 family transcriptional regulator [Eubacteriales bacterium]